MKGNQDWSTWTLGLDAGWSSAALPCPELLSTEDPLQDLLQGLVLGGLRRPLTSALDLQRSFLLQQQPSANDTQDLNDKYRSILVPHEGQGVSAFHTISRGPCIADPCLLPAAVRCLLMRSVPAFFPSFPHSPSRTSRGCFPNKITCSKIFVSGSAFGGKPSIRLQNECVSYFWVCTRKLWELLLFLVSTVIATATIVWRTPYIFFFGSTNSLHFAPFTLSFILFSSIRFPSPLYPLFLSTGMHTHIYTLLYTYTYYYFLNHLRVNWRLVPFYP